MRAITGVQMVELEESYQDMCNSVLKDISKSDNLVVLHQGWGHVINFGERNNSEKSKITEIQEVGLIYEKSRLDIELQLYFGDDITQAVSLYRNPDVTYESFLRLEKKGWRFKPNFHLNRPSGPIAPNLHDNGYFSTKVENNEAYFNFFNASGNRYYFEHRMSKAKMIEKVGNLIRLGIIERQQYSGYMNLNFNEFGLCPGFGLFYPYPFQIRSQNSDQNTYLQNR